MDVRGPVGVAMSEEGFYAAVGKTVIDPEFGRRVMQEPAEAVADAGFDLEDPEVEQLKMLIEGQAAAADDWAFERSQARRRSEATSDLGAYTVNILKNTINHAANTYKAITFMNKTMFWTGITLFVGASIYGAASRQAVISFVFAGLGVSTFVAVFLTGAIEKSQTALSNLVQVEICFMNYFEQLMFWERAAATAVGSGPAAQVAGIEKASTMLQQRSAEIVHLLQHYVEAPMASPSSAVEEREVALDGH